MKRALASCLAAVLLVACGDRIPTAPAGGPLAAISDGRSATGNPDFFWLPPVAGDPSGEPAFEAAEFNPNLSPGVAVCRLANPSAGDAAVCTGSPLVLDSTPATLDASLTFYRYDWATPSSLAPEDTLRVFAFVGTTQLGFVDVTPRPGGAKNVKTDEYFQFQDGRTLPLKFRIENAALCYALDPDFRNPAAGHDPNEPCVSATLEAGESLVLETDAADEVIATVTLEAPPSGGPAGALAQAASAGAASTITMRECRRGHTVADFVDLPTFGDCVDIESDPPLTSVGLRGRATMCQAFDDAVAAGLSEAQRRRIVIHNLVDEAEGIVLALPEGDGFCPEPTGPGASRIGLGPLDRLLHVATAAWDAARETVGAWLAPGSLWATLVCDRGCAGDGFESPVQAALPAQMDPYPNPDTDLGSHRVGTTLPAVQVRITDAGGDPVANAVLTFDPTPPAGSASDPAPIQVTTGTDGIASFTWTLGSHWGVNTLSVSGRGIADPSCADEATPCGPLGVYAPDHETGTEPVTLGTGEIVFTALGVDADLIIQSLTHSPADPNSLDNITFTAVVQNLGPGPAEASTLEFRIGGETPGAPATQFPLEGLAAGETATVERQMTLPPGAYRNTAVADVNDDVPESNETNNQATDDYTVTPPPDLVVSITRNPANPTSADAVTFIATVTNQGTGPSRATTLDFRIANEAFGTAGTQFAIPALPAGASDSVVRDTTLTPGTYNDTAYADVNHDVPETDETNNTATGSYIVVEPDLAWELALESVEPGEAFTYYNLDVINYSFFADELFAPAPDLPPCGLNTNASRTWVDIYNQDGVRLYGFCALGSAADLNNIWFAIATGSTPPTEVYIVLTDRQTGTTYTSNRVSLSP